MKQNNIKVTGYNIKNEDIRYEGDTRIPGHWDKCLDIQRQYGEISHKRRIWKRTAKSQSLVYSLDYWKPIQIY